MDRDEMIITPMTVGCICDGKQCNECKETRREINIEHTNAYNRYLIDRVLIRKLEEQVAHADRVEQFLERKIRLQQELLDKIVHTTECYSCHAKLTGSDKLDINNLITELNEMRMH